MEVASRQIFSAQGDRRTSFQLPVSKGTILPAAVRQNEQNNSADGYLGVGKVRASSANPTRRTIANTRSSVDASNNNFLGNKGFYMSEGESPRVTGNNILQQQQLQIMQQQQQQINLLHKQQINYDNMKANNQKMNYITEVIAARPPSGSNNTRNISSAGGNGYHNSGNGSYSPSPRQLQQQYSQYASGSGGSNALALTSGGQNGHNGPGPGGASMFRNNTGASAHNYHLMMAAAGQNMGQNSASTNAQLSSSMPLQGSSKGGGGFNFNASSAPDSADNARGMSASPSLNNADSDLVSILSTSSVGGKGMRRTDRPKKRVKFADKIASFACVSDFDTPSGNPSMAHLNGGRGPLPRPNSAAAALSGGVTYAQKTANLTAGAANNNAAAAVGSGSSILASISNYLATSSQPQAAATPAGGIAFSANLTSGTINFHAAEDRATINNAANNIATVQNTLSNLSIAAPPSSSSSAAQNNTTSSSGNNGIQRTPSGDSPLPSIAPRKTITVSNLAAGQAPRLLVPPTAATTTSLSSAADQGGAGAASPATSGAFYLNTASAPTTANGTKNNGQAAPQQQAPSSSSTAATAGSSPVVNNNTKQGNNGNNTNGNTNSSGKKAKPVRPSLSEQLANIGAKAEAITSDIRIKGKLDSGNNNGGNGNSSNGFPMSNGDTALYTMPARCFSIGSLSCRFPSPVHFYADRCEYIFNHPFESSIINMVIYYRDMSAISILGTKFKFKLPKRLACFSTDFDPQNPHHMINIELSSMLSVSVVREKVLPLISTFK